MPLLMGTYMLQYLDKSSINFAAVFGLEEGTHLVGQQYAWQELLITRVTTEKCPLTIS